MNQYREDPTHVYNKLSEFLFRCTKMGTDYMIAKVLMEKRNEFPEILIENVAKEAMTTPASVTKFCKKIGYKSFYELRNDIEVYSGWDTFAKMRQLSEEQQQSDIFSLLMEQDQQLTKQIYSRLDQQQMQQISGAIGSDCNGVVITPSYALGPSNLFQEIAKERYVNVFKLSRHAEQDVVYNLCRDSRFIFFLSLTGKWINDNIDMLRHIREQEIYMVAVCGKEDDIQEAELFDEVVSLGTPESIFQSNYISYKYLTLLFMTIIFSAPAL
ncbi:MurR/RpiR family transcriptional regulator [Culicoidibacter larvae]|uniref:MurR/RpiR family transcriptional regulator n=1 Tax=Culicoidibacter larvae TaxID=2579976 RepID=A0A5R8Q9U2_9FIRM|nr:MurR/RpiR family transcriptional regulator [Culicoidibacter larvae]TLG72693.1 MurR/RpiR family transcriptional regulator [Culicoidibacter larvae]